LIRVGIFGEMTLPAQRARTFDHPGCRPHESALPDPDLEIRHIDGGLRVANFFVPRGEPSARYGMTNDGGYAHPWKLTVPLGGSGTVGLWGGYDRGEPLSISSNNPGVIGFEEPPMSFGSGDRFIRVTGKRTGFTILDASSGNNVWCSIQVEVTAPAGATAGGGDLQIVLSPIQLAAILENTTIAAPETASNRLLGGIKILGGAIELVGAAALLAVPEPTMATKVGGVVLAAHGSDTMSAGLQQVFSGRPQTTLTAQAAEAAARSMGVDPDGAITVGMTVDIAVPMIAGFAGAARVAAVRGGTMTIAAERNAINLAAEEAAGGHTIARHVGRTEAQLRARLAAEARIPAASTYRTLLEAEETVSAGLKANAVAIKTWAASARAGARLTLSYDAGETIGLGVVRATGRLQDMSKITLVLQKIASGNKIYFILTSYPKP